MSENIIGEEYGKRLIDFYTQLSDCRTDEAYRAATRGLNTFVVSHELQRIQVETLETDNGSLEWRVGRHFGWHLNSAIGSLDRAKTNQDSISLDMPIGRLAVRPVNHQGVPLVRLTFLQAEPVEHGPLTARWKL